MKRSTLSSICAAALLTASSVSAADSPTPGPAPAAAPAAAPKIDFDSTTFNFGKVKAGETVKHDFIFTNTGAATLEISDVKAGCGCTTAGAWDKKVEPGKTGIIPLQFNSTGFGGQVSKSATITCNDPARTNLFLAIAGTVWKPIDVTPQMAMFNISDETPTNETKVLRIVSNLDEPITLSDLECKNASFKAELKEVKPGKEFELHVTAVPSSSSATLFSTITIKTSSTNAPTLSISAYATVLQAVTVSPQQLFLPAGPLKAPHNTTVLVRNNSTNTFEISDVRLDIPGVDVKVAQPQTGHLYSITMSFPAGFELEPGKKPQLTMKSSNPKFAEIKVPVVQMQAAAAAPAPAPTAPAPSQLRTAAPPGPTPPGPATALAPVTAAQSAPR